MNEEQQKQRAKANETINQRTKPKAKLQFHLGQTINELARQIHLNMREQGFWDEYLEAKNKRPFISEKLMLVNTELSEGMEALRNGTRCPVNGPQLRQASIHDAEPEVDGVSVFESMVKDSFEDELADAAIRLFDLANGLGIDLEAHIVQKCIFNTTRARKHGKLC